jgi:hypothetical protein
MKAAIYARVSTFDQDPRINWQDCAATSTHASGRDGRSILKTAARCGSVGV